MDQFDQIRTTEDKSAENVNDSVETLTNSKPEDQISSKTEQYVENIEHKVDDLYLTLEKNTSNGWKSFSGFLTNFQKNIPEYVNQTKDKIEKLSISEGEKSQDETTAAKKLDAQKYFKLIKESTNTYLDELDSDLQEVENLVGGFASKFGKILKDVITVDDDTTLNDENEELDGDEANVLFNVPDDSKVFGTRAEQRLHQLNNSKTLYLNSPLNKSAFDSFAKNFKLENSETEKALSSNKELATLYNKIVPSEITAEQFWLKYFYNKALIDEEESTKKKLLAKTTSDEEEDKFAWDDDEEEETHKQDVQLVDPDSRTSSEVTYNLESANSSTLDVVASKKDDKGKNTTQSTTTDTADAGDDEEDDWE